MYSVKIYYLKDNKPCFFRCTAKSAKDALIDLHTKIDKAVNPRIISFFLNINKNIGEK